MKKNKDETPIRRGLHEKSSLVGKVENGIAAVGAQHRERIDLAIRSKFVDSIDLDAALKAEYPTDNRWDYLLGHGPSAKIVAVEPHSAKHDEISTVIAKRKAADTQLRNHLRDGVQISCWLWVSSGDVQFAGIEKVRFRLAQEGIQFVGKRILSKHLPST